MNIPTQERLIVALDVPDVDKAKSLVRELGDTVHFYKIGLELAMSGRYFELLEWLLRENKRVFADLKFYDIPATVAAAVRQVRNLGATFLTIHGERTIAEAAAAEKGEHLKLLAVTVLTSISQQDLHEIGIETDLGSLAEARAQLALEAGCDGMITSGLEAERLRSRLGEKALIVTPGIRPANKSGADDQKRVVTPSQAFANGADYIVVGRPIRAAAKPAEAAAQIQAEIAQFFK
ncbi:MAG TPA: orotidine-5'-phosphate decarboxylase, partial [Gammaproteobacteria bacterium]|nr:orotidine-5'-phosphate decarboxylase [Gammaproteobacteria bacterium]